MKIANCQLPIADFQNDFAIPKLAIGNWQLAIVKLAIGNRQSAIVKSAMKKPPN